MLLRAVRNTKKNLANTLAESVAGKNVTIEYNKRDRYERLVGKVLLNRQDMNLRQVQAGLAWHYKKYQSEQSLEDRQLYAVSEEEARKARLGLWQDPKPTAPWDWQKMKRQK